MQNNRCEMGISKDEQERARLKSEYKYTVDLQSKEADAKRNRTIEIARKLLEMNLSPDQIVKATDLTIEQIERLRD